VIESQVDVNNDANDMQKVIDGDREKERRANDDDVSTSLMMENK
jgi:hypothetical protein